MKRLVLMTTVSLLLLAGVSVAQPGGPGICQVYVKCDFDAAGNVVVACCPDPVKVCPGQSLQWCIDPNCANPAGGGPVVINYQGFVFPAPPGGTTPPTPPFPSPAGFGVSTYTVEFLGVPVAQCQIKTLRNHLIPCNGGDGSDGVFAPTVSTSLNTATQSVYNFTNVLIPSGVTVRVVGPNPCTIKSLGKIEIFGTLDASGLDGLAGDNNTPGGMGGMGGPGAGRGGNGACGPVMPFNGTGQNGFGPGGGGGGMDSAGAFADPVGGGGGGGNATAGQPGVGGAFGGAAGPAVSPCRAGSGGGGGACDVDSMTTPTSNDGGGGGGGGGGRLCLWSKQVIVVGLGGSILANGGNGGDTDGNGGGGGGGSGGAIDLVAKGVCITGRISAVGGLGGAANQVGCGCSPGGDGGDGCIDVVGDLCVTPNGSLVPAPTVCPHGLVITPSCSINRKIDVCGFPNLPYLALLSGTCGPPITFPGLCNPFELNLQDPLLQLVFPVNTLAPAILGIQGVTPGQVCFNLPMLPPGIDLKLWMQSVVLDPAVPFGVGGVSCKTPVIIKT